MEKARLKKEGFFFGEVINSFCFLSTFFAGDAIIYVFFLSYFRSLLLHF